MFSGSIPALVTPFSRNGAFDEPAFRRLVPTGRSNTAAPRPWCPAGTTGEASTLSQCRASPRESKSASNRLRGRVPVIAGCGSNDTRNAALHMNFARKAGAAAGLCVAPYYNRPSQAGLIAHFSYSCRKLRAADRCCITCPLAR